VRRRRELLGLAFVVVTTSGCGLDKNGLEAVRPDATATAPGGPTTEAGSSGGDPDASGSASPDATLSGDGSSGAVDSSIEDTAPPDVHILDPDASYEEAGNECDLDQDGYKSSSDGCGGDDCCDYDSRANPGDTSYYSVADACGSFDYDCNGKLDAQYAQVNCQLGFFVCSGNGFDQAPPACGVTATFDTCNDAVFVCTTSQSQVAQGCR
jgi:hypothetical protein